MRFPPSFILFALCGALSCCALAEPDSPKTGETDFTFTERSPQSSVKELARRLVVPEKELSPDYDLSKLPYKAYVPKNYDPTTPVGVFVYLNYKDSTNIPSGWGPALDEMHLIFITPVCHSGQSFANGVPFWQSDGLALDAVHNLKKLYKVQGNRIYLMTWDHTMQSCTAMADVFTGFAAVGVNDFYKRLSAGNGGFFPPKFSPPPQPLPSLAQGRGFFLIYGAEPSAGDSRAATANALPHEGFRHTTIAVLSLTDDLHAPNMALDWFKNKAIPFLDGAVATESKGSEPKHVEVTSKEPKSATPASAPSAVSPAQHQLDMAKLYLKNNQTDLARSKLGKIVNDYPDDPAAQTARKLLDDLNKP